jgi:hypothetical protein
MEDGHPIQYTIEKRKELKETKKSPRTPEEIAGRNGCSL